MIYYIFVFGQVAQGFAVTFSGPPKFRAFAILFIVGAGATIFYLFMLPSPAVGGLSAAALHYLTPLLVILAILLGFGLSATLAINLTALKKSTSSRAVGVMGVLSSVLPGSLCCTSIVPSMLALAGASAPSIIGSTGKIQSVFALHENGFLLASLAGVVLSVALAARNASSSCIITGNMT